MTHETPQVRQKPRQSVEFILREWCGPDFWKRKVWGQGKASKVMGTAGTQETGGAWNLSDENTEMDVGERCLLDRTESHIGDEALGVSVRKSID